jgi:hypothetical protein
MKRFFLLLGAVFLLANSSHADVAVNVSTFNMKWFGIGGDPNNVQKEFRIPIMKDFLAKHFSFSQIFVFEEVVDLTTLKLILPQGWECVGYQHPMVNHQHVAICAVPEISLEKVSYDTNFVIEEVAAESPRMRPAVRVDVKVRNTRKLLFTLVGVHFKAMPNETARRLTQARAVAKDLTRIPANIPVVITGDFNVYSAKETKLPEDDISLVLRAFNEGSRGATYAHVPHQQNAKTFRSPKFKNQFDQFYVRGPLKVTTIPVVFPVCGATQDGPGYLNFSFYYKNVSDHCPTGIQVIVR